MTLKDIQKRAQTRAKDELQARAEARESLLGFTRYTMPGYEVAPHHRLICEKLEAVERGECKRLMIFTPPRFGKSELVSRRWPARYIGKFPSAQFISASYGDDLATDFGRDVRNLIASEKYRRLYPGTALASDSSAKGKWHTTAGGIYISTSVGKGITGRGANCLLGDTIISTDQGEAPIKSVVSGSAPRYVLSYDDSAGTLVYRRITAALRREAEGFYRVHTASGRVVEATGDHRFFTPAGYVEARLLAEGDILLRSVRVGGDASSLCCDEVVGAWSHPPVLQQQMLGQGGERTKWATDRQVRDVLHADATHRNGTEAKSVLFGRLQEGKTSGAQRGSGEQDTGSRVRNVQSCFPAEGHNATWSVLQSHLQGSGARAGYRRHEESGLSARDGDESRQPAAVDRHKAGCVGSGSHDLRSLPQDGSAGCASHQHGTQRQSSGKLGFALPEVSPQPTCCGSFEAESDAVSLVERVCEPADVFDITVDGTHCFFANGILVHNCLNIDDPVKDRIEAESETVRKNIWDWYASTAYTRLMPGGAIVLTMTRWHEADLAGKLLEASEAGGEKWDVITLPAFANAADDPLGRAVDEPLWPSRYSAEALTRIREVIGEREFGALYQQQPRPLGTSFFDVQNCLVNGEPVDYPNRPDCVFAVIDTATKTGAKHDGTGCTFFALTNGRGIPLVVLDWDIVKIEGSLLETWLPTVFERLEQLAQQTKARMGSAGAYIEDKNSGTVLIQHAIRNEWPAQAIDSKLTAAGKDERAISVMGHVSAQEVKLSRHAYDKTSIYNGRSGNHFLMQVFRFQIGIKDQEDDILDCFCYGIAIGLGGPKGYA